MNVTLSLSGGSQLAKALQASGEALTKTILIEALKMAADPMRLDMATRMKRGTSAPHAADHVIIAVVNDVDGEALAPKEFAVGIGPTKDFWYWFFQEFGTVHHPAQPAMRPAFDSGAERALRAIGHALWEAIARHAGSARSTTGRAA